MKLKGGYTYDKAQSEVQAQDEVLGQGSKRRRVRRRLRRSRSRRELKRKRSQTTGGNKKTRRTKR